MTSSDRSGKSQRLDKVLVHLGVGSRSEVQKLVRQGLVYCDGKQMMNPAEHILPDEVAISVAGVALYFSEFYYYMLNKPQGVISATNSPYGERTVLDLLAAGDLRMGLFPVGRLDKDSEGLLLLTTDGQLAHRLLAPKSRVPKRYLVAHGGALGQEAVAAFQQGVVLEDGEVCLPAELYPQVQVKDPPYRHRQEERDSGTLSWAEIVIYEGKFHQVKRMLLSVGCQTVYLRRLSFGPLNLDTDLAPGEYRLLRENEVAALRESVTR
ncbi:MAG: rRNA pseudouridine synthase [Symbiobacteriaceae bacterium]|nr:rRNA pseudouridine synthase [Symbiobacteriaceae bacterium]